MDEHTVRQLAEIHDRLNAAESYLRKRVVDLTEELRRTKNHWNRTLQDLEGRVYDLEHGSRNGR